MKLFEYEAKEILSKYGIPTPTGGLITSPKQARETAERIKSPVVVKAQVLVAGRGKAGGILLASSPAEAELSSSKLLSSKIKGIKVQRVLVEEQTLLIRLA